MTSESILGFGITTASLNECNNTIYNWVENEKNNPRYLIALNPHSIYLAKNDKLFSSAINHADLVIPDGIGIVIASRIMGGKILCRITGSDIFYSLSNYLNMKQGHKYFFLGSSKDNLELIIQKMKELYPNIIIAGSFAPPFKDYFSNEENDEMVNMINQSKTDVLWVGMTAPKQEKWTYTNIGNLNVKLIVPVGAVFDYFSGSVKRSSLWYQQHGLEWLPRLLKDPKRLWRRNLISNPMFLFKIVMMKLSRNKQSYK